MEVSTNRPNARRRSRSLLGALIMASAALSPIFFGNSPAFSVGEPLRFTAPLNGNTAVSVVYMGSYTGTGASMRARVSKLVTIADLSTCTTNPLAEMTKARNRWCDGFMTQGDRVVVGDGYMAWMDLKVARYGGGGTLRGLWIMKNPGQDDTSANPFNFLYLDANNRAMNNLFPCQPNDPNWCNTRGDAGHELLLSTNGGDVAKDTWYASGEQNPSVFDDGTWNATSRSVTFHYHGTMTKNDYKTVNLGNGSKAYYNLKYTFYNDPFPSQDPRNAFGIESESSIDICGAGPGCGAPSPVLATAVSSWAVQAIRLAGPTELKYFTPKTHPMYAELNCNTFGPLQADVGQRRFLEDDGKYVAMTGEQSGFGVRFSSDGTRAIDFNNSAVAGIGIPTGGKSWQMIINDQDPTRPLEDRVFDQKVGGDKSCSNELGVLAPNQGVSFRTTLGLESAQPIKPTIDTTTTTTTTTTSPPPSSTTTTTAPPPPPPPPPQCSNGGDDDGDGFADMADPGCNDFGDNAEGDGAQWRLGPGNFLDVDQYMESGGDRRFRLVMQGGDGNLVLYDKHAAGGWRALWASSWCGQLGMGGGQKMWMQMDGNLVVGYDGVPKWWAEIPPPAGCPSEPRTGMVRRSGSELHLQTDGNLVVYGGGSPTWYTNTKVR